MHSMSSSFYSPNSIHQFTTDGTKERLRQTCESIRERVFTDPETSQREFNRFFFLFTQALTEAIVCGNESDREQKIQIQLETTDSSIDASFEWEGSGRIPDERRSNPLGGYSIGFLDDSSSIDQFEGLSRFGDRIQLRYPLNRHAYAMQY